MLVLSERGGAYEEVATAVRGELQGAAEITQLQLNELDVLSRLRPRVAVAIGTQACRGIADTAGSTPLMCALLPRNAFEKIAKHASKQRSMSAVLLDQPVPRQLALIRLGLPRAKQLAILVGRDSLALSRTISSNASEHGFRVNTAEIASTDTIFGALRRVLNDADVLLAVPDAAVYNSRTIQNILRTTFQSHVPVVAFSPAYVRAGALLAVYSTPTQIGRQAGRGVSAFISGRPLPGLQSPREFEVSVNPHVARALALPIPDERVLAEQLRKMEQAR